MEVIIELVENGEHSLTTMTKSKITVGRDSECDIVLSDDGASKIHCSIEFSKNQFWIIDENSKNGTYINQTPIKRANFYMEDIIQIGESFIRFASKEMSIALCQRLRRPGKKIVMNKSITLVQSSKNNEKKLVKESEHHGAKELTGVEMTKKFKSPGKAIEKVKKKKAKK
jgi:pSer/pThr/pTyr-binding forkhead associated (FHA) protein